MKGVNYDHYSNRSYIVGDYQVTESVLKSGINTKIK